MKIKDTFILLLTVTVLFLALSFIPEGRQCVYHSKCDSEEYRTVCYEGKALQNLKKRCENPKEEMKCICEQVKNQTKPQ